MPTRLAHQSQLCQRRSCTRGTGLTFTRSVLAAASVLTATAIFPAKNAVAQYRTTELTATERARLNASQILRQHLNYVHPAYTRSKAFEAGYRAYADTVKSPKGKTAWEKINTAPTVRLTFLGEHLAYSQRYRLEPVPGIGPDPVVSASGVYKIFAYKTCSAVCVR